LRRSTRRSNDVRFAAPIAIGGSPRSVAGISDSRP
jgi:hypothetical protein